MKEPVAKSVGYCWFADGGVPMFCTELAGEDSGAGLVSVLSNFEPVGSLGFTQGCEQEIVDDEQLNFGDFAQ